MGYEMWDGLFEAFRDFGDAPTLYPSIRTAVTVDVLEIGFVFAALIVLLACLLTIPGTRGWCEKIKTLVKIVFFIWITLFIFLCNFGQEWEVAHIHTKTQYRAGTAHEIDADIEVRIGLRSVNITLKGDPEYQHTAEHETEQINYNERFDWSEDAWQQGRGGFGPFAGNVNQEFRQAQFRGVPYPILWIAEYFTIDGEGIRWGRYYRQAGFYAHIFLWLAFPFWILTVILLQSAIVYGICFCLLTGICHLLACAIFACVRNPTDLKIPFEDDVLEFHWGWAWGMSFFNGLLLVILALIILIFDWKCPDFAADFLGVDRLSEYEEYYVSADELKEMGIRVDSTSGGGSTLTSSVKTSSSGSFSSLKRILSNKPKILTPGLRRDKSDSTGSENSSEDGGAIQLFRRKSRTSGIQGVARKVQNTFKKKNPGMARQESEMYRYTGEDDMAMDNDGFDISVVDKPHAGKQWNVLPEGTTIRAKTAEEHKEKRQQQKSLETYDEEDEDEEEYEGYSNTDDNHRPESDQLHF